MKIQRLACLAVLILVSSFPLVCAAQQPAATPVPPPASVLAPPFECVVPSDYYQEPTTVPEVLLGPVTFTWYPGVTRESLFQITDCSGDRLLDVGILFSPAQPAEPRARILFNPELCGIAGPSSVRILLQHQSLCILRALSEKDTVLAEAVVSPGSPQYVYLSAEGIGISSVEFEGAEICVMEVCWNCEYIPPTPPPSSGCVGAGDVYGQPTFGVPEVNLGPVLYTWEPEPTPEFSYNVLDCAGDTGLDVEIPVAPPVSSTPRAKIEFSTNLCGGKAPTDVEVTLQHGNACTLYAADERGAIVDSRVVKPGVLETVAFSHPAGIRSIYVEGSEICIVDVCWVCPTDTPTPTTPPTNTPIPSPTPPPTDTPVFPTPTVAATPGPLECIRPGDVFPEPGPPEEIIDLGPVMFVAALLPDGQTPSFLSVTDCSGDGQMDVAVPWSEATAASLARIYMSSNLCGGAAPQQVEVTLLHGLSCTLNAYDESQALVDTAVAAPGAGPQTLVLSSPNGIRQIQIVGAEICIMEVCWICEVESPTPTVTPPPGEGECVSAADFYRGPVPNLELVDLGTVLFTAAQLPTGGFAYLSVDDCWVDGLMDVVIPWSEASAFPPARIEFTDLACGGMAPVQAQVILRHWNYCNLSAYDGDGNLVDTATAAPHSDPQSLVLGSDAGIRYIEIDGSEICVMRVCWICPPPPPITDTPTLSATPTETPTVTATNTRRPTFTPTITATPAPGGCIRAADVYPEPVPSTEIVDLGPVMFVAARLPAGEIAYLSVIDCSGDGELDVSVPWSEETGASLARMEMSPNLCGGSAPQRVEVTLQHGNACTLKAYDDTGGLVDTSVAELNSGPQTLVLSSPAGIRKIEIVGAEICIMEVCWLCEAEIPTPTVTPPPGEGECVSAADFYRGPVPDLEMIDLETVRFTAAGLPTGGTAYLAIEDCWVDGQMDVFIPWSEGSASPPARIEFTDFACAGMEPMQVDVILRHWNYCTLTAYDSGGTFVDSVTAAPHSNPQSLILMLGTSGTGIRYIEVEGSEICVLEVCWTCPPLPPITHTPTSTDTPTVTPTYTFSPTCTPVFPAPAFRALPESCEPGVEFEVLLDYPGGSCSEFSRIAEVVPPGWVVTDPPYESRDGDTVRWSEFINRYKVYAPPGTASGEYQFTGWIEWMPAPPCCAGGWFGTIGDETIACISVQPTVTPTPTPESDLYAFPFLPVIEVLVPYPFLSEDLSIHGIEVTQAIQHFDTNNGVSTEPDNSVPLVLGKSTTARIYLRYTNSLFAGAGERDGVPVRFYFRNQGSSVWTSVLATATARGTIDQSDPNHSANILFALGATAPSRTIEMYAVVDPSNTITETNESNNRYPAVGYLTMTFHRREPVQVRGRRLDYHPGGYTGTRHAGGWAVNGGGAQWWNAILPLPNGGVQYSLASGYLDWTTSLGSSDGQHELIEYLNAEYGLATIFSILFTGHGLETDKIFGWCPQDGYTGGHADMPMYPHAGGLGVVAIGTDVPGTSVDNPGRGAIVFGHELCHTYNVQHTDTGADDCGADDGSSDFPYATSSIQEFGFNPATSNVYNPSNTHDLMSYCPPGSKLGWISPFHWTKMYNALPASKMSPKMLTPNEKPQPNTLYITADQQSLLVASTIDNPTMAGQIGGVLGDVYLVDTGATLVIPEGEYAVELRDGGAVLSRQDFAVTFANDYETPGYVEPEYPDAHVSFIIPWVAGTTSVVLLHGDTILDQRPVSPNPPAVTITQPDAAVEWNAGTVETVAWEASDPDGGELAYAILYSNDGGAGWQMLGSGLTSQTYDVAVDSLAGGTDCRFRVTANDGVNTAFDETDAPITVPRKAPVGVITNPLPGARFAEGGAVVLEGIGTDLEDGAIPPEGLQWFSDRQGSLGSGPSVPVAILEPGVHTITLEVTDSDLQMGSDSVEITINSIEEFMMDLNQDGFLDQRDLAEIMKRWKQSVDEGFPPSKADVTQDGTIDAEDLFEFQRHWNP